MGRIDIYLGMYEMEDESLGVPTLGIHEKYIHVAREPQAQPRSPSEGWPIHIGIEHPRQFELGLHKAWAAIPDSLIAQLIRSMPGRLDGIRHGMGYQTIY